jgi:hypothetical protein
VTKRIPSVSTGGTSLVSNLQTLLLSALIGSGCSFVRILVGAV